MNHPIDTSSFPAGDDIDYESEEEIEQLTELTAEARAFVETIRGEERTSPRSREGS